MQRTNAPYIHIETVSVAKNNDGPLAATITAPDVDGYSFVCWASVATNGDVGTPYIEHAESRKTDVWDAARKGSKIDAVALYQRS